MTSLPTPRGALSATLVRILSDAPEAGSLAEFDRLARESLRGAHGLVEDDDVQLTLFCLYELFYGGFDGVSDDWEWNPELLRTRALLEEAFEAELRARIPVPEDLPTEAEAIAQALFACARADDSPSTAKYIAREATLDEVRDFLKLRSIYQLKEADPHTWAIPRLRGVPKAALVEIQTDEYGSGNFDRMHSKLFGDSMRAVGLESAYGAYLDDAPGYLLASTNMMSMFGLHRRLRGAIIGHLAAYEMTSSIPCRQVSNGFARLGISDAAEYFDEHIEADAVHEQIATRDLAGRLGEQEPGLIPDIFFGAAACLTVDGWAGARMIESWKANREMVTA